MEPSFVPERSATLGACKTGLIILPKAHRHVVWVLYDQKKSCATFFFNRLLCTTFLFMHNTSFLVETRSFSGIPTLGKGEYTQFHTLLRLRLLAPRREKRDLYRPAYRARQSVAPKPRRSNFDSLHNLHNNQRIRSSRTEAYPPRCGSGAEHGYHCKTEANQDEQPT